jgi:hypothetical protein
MQIHRMKNPALCETGFPTLAEMRELNTTIVATRVIMNERHPIRHYFTKTTEYKMNTQ